MLKNVQIPNGIADYKPPKNHNYNNQHPNIMPCSEFEFHMDEKRKNNSLRLSTDQVVYVVETLLTFWATVKYGTKILLKSDIKFKIALQSLELLWRVVTKSIY